MRQHSTCITITVTLACCIMELTWVLLRFIEWIKTILRDLGIDGKMTVKWSVWLQYSAQFAVIYVHHYDNNVRKYLCLVHTIVGSVVLHVIKFVLCCQHLQGDWLCLGWCWSDWEGMCQLYRKDQCWARDVEREEGTYLAFTQWKLGVLSEKRIIMWSGFACETNLFTILKLHVFYKTVGAIKH
jgi:hypothetical protein